MFGGVEQSIPCDDLGVVDQQPPELDEVAVDWSFVRQCALHELIEFRVAFTRALKLNSGRFGRALMMLAETGDAR